MRLDAVSYIKNGDPKDGDFDYIKIMLEHLPDGKYIIELHSDYLREEDK